MSSNNQTSSRKPKKTYHIPSYDLNAPDAGPQKPVYITHATPIHSSYTSKLIGYGPMLNNIINDAPPGHPNYGKTYHVIERNPVNDSYMAHGFGQYYRY
jgi:hypothetical protein